MIRAGCKRGDAVTRWRGGAVARMRGRSYDPSSSRGKSRGCTIFTRNLVFPQVRVIIVFRQHPAPPPSAPVSPVSPVSPSSNGYWNPAGMSHVVSSVWAL